MALSAGETFSVVVRLQNESYAYPLAVETFTPDPEVAGAEPEHMGYDAQGDREVSWVSADGVTWEDPAGYGHDLALGKAGSGEGAGAGATVALAADGTQAASAGGSARSYVTNVCVRRSRCRVMREAVRAERRRCGAERRPIRTCPHR